MLEKREANFTIRQASAADADRLALIGSATFLETLADVLDGAAIVAHCLREHSAAAYRRMLDAGALARLAEAKLGGAPIGFGLLGAANQSGPAATLAISNFDAATCAGARRVPPDVYAHNARAASFYARNGFVHTCPPTAMRAPCGRTASPHERFALRRRSARSSRK